MIDRPRYRGRYQMELACTLTGKKATAIRQLMQRKEIDLIAAIKYYLKLK